jgi:hypothetical protein
MNALRVATVLVLTVIDRPAQGSLILALPCALLIFMLDCILAPLIVLLDRAPRTGCAPRTRLPCRRPEPAF